MHRAFGLTRIQAVLGRCSFTHCRNIELHTFTSHTALRRTAKVMAVIFAHPSFQYYAQDGEMGKNKKALKIK